ncbi:family 22 glycosyltransferase [Sodiomyces alkalinus F11]|uniref:Mannosyltransferase n=1 Tax=Sodiomyces alkalinus (strain CBS 110278 / VKM F-3762 / F11) TaxID=1314773 RepID=A0A3N2Q608_SODAK|nr:family 22 glycosyltransferase [Sodiomyces alkalinus F11]ROT42223.1 family 22 glycosyltransferase [Sodiomyces alkalinus F11]
MPSQAPQHQQRREYVHPAASHAKRKSSSPYAIAPSFAFYCFLLAGLVSAWFAPIQDCDETFNYYEPTHYLSHSYGLQTWEYSPTYAIRSWLYIALHAVVGNIRRLLPRPTKVAEFYFIRYGLALACAVCQTLLYCVVSTTVNARIGFFFLLATVLSAGNFHASTAFLPSSFAMYAAMLGAAACMNWRGGVKTAQGITWFAVGAVFGWPFAAALCIPFVLEELLLAFIGDPESSIEAIHRLVRGVAASFILLLVDSGVNTFFYRHIEIVPWNIVKYNVFGDTGGPDLYGTEPWTFYFRNLLLNFNIWFVLALLCLPIFLLRKIVAPSSQDVRSGLRLFVFMAPFYLWLAIFTLQPHKEERFMYPAYPFLALNGAIALHIILTSLGRVSAGTFLGKVPARLRALSVLAVLGFSAFVALARIYGLVTAYSAPLEIYAPLAIPTSAGGVGGHYGDFVCLGKEWHRFPSSYFLPDDMHAKFIRSEFRGLLPGEFSEAGTGFGFWSGTWLPTSGMNDRNQEDPSKYVDLRTCSFLVDTQYPERTGALPPNEPDYVADEEKWAIVKCVPFLDAANTHVLARALWVPDSPLVPERYQRKWGRHCLLRRKG